MCQSPLVMSDLNSVFEQSEGGRPHNFKLLNETGDLLPWLSNDYVEKVLQDFHEDPTIHVDKMLIRLCSAKGDNYASSMYRMQVEFNSDKLVSLKFFRYKESFDHLKFQIRVHRRHLSSLKRCVKMSWLLKNWEQTITMFNAKKWTCTLEFCQPSRKY